MYKDLSLAISPGKSRATRASQTFRQSQFVAVYMFAVESSKDEISGRDTSTHLQVLEISSFATIV